MTALLNQNERGDGMSSNSSETTSLLGTLPSAHSTSRPTRSSYSRSSIPLASSLDDVRESVEKETLLSFQEEVLRSKSARQPSIDLTRRQAAFILMIGCALTVAFVSFPVLRWERKHMAQQPDCHGKPFSLHHPVHDLGLLNFVRAEETSPPAETIRLHQQEETEPTRLGSGKQPSDKAAVPTNAWYQNMLLLRGEPSNIHRVYSTPYVLDPAGLIPGINVHANHVDSSSRVMQLSYIDNFGLALGASGDAASAEGTGMVSHQYSVVETTELGLTLQWVSGTDRRSQVFSFSVCQFLTTFGIYF
jgi:hypothetical protein